jgi:hypothetical protein
MDEQTRRWVAMLEAEFAEPDGFLWKVRYGDFDAEQGERFVGLLSQIKPPKDGPLERRLVSIVWFLPLLVMWQKDRITASGGDPQKYDGLIGRVTDAVIAILGVP